MLEIQTWICTWRIREPNGLATLAVAKRLMDMGYHPPTVYFPLIVHEALMVEPTESESKETLGGFAESMIKIAKRSWNKSWNCSCSSSWHRN